MSSQSFLGFDGYNSSQSMRHAIVIGGSIAGLLAARVLTDHFEQVTIVERDCLPQKPEFRNGVPQAHHFHLLLGRGLNILEQMFPKLGANLTAAGAVELDWGEDSLLLGSAGWYPRFRSELKTITCSRNLLEWSVRCRLVALRRVNFVQGHDVTGLLVGSNNADVTGVRIRERSSGKMEELRAELVVDASGRNSSAPKWLEAIGYSAPLETKIDSFLGYATRIYSRPPGFQADWQSVYLLPKPPEVSQVAALYPLEGDRWVVSLAGAARNYPPTNEAGFLDFARSLRSPIIFEAIKDAKPLSPIYGYRNTQNRLRHYERMTSLPEGFVALGDAVCAFNPVYGQGITNAARGALVLNECLLAQSRQQGGNGLKGLARCFQRRLAKVNAGPWLQATALDFRYPTTQGGRPDWKIRVVQWYIDQLNSVSLNHPTVHLASLKVLNRLEPSGILLQPGIVAQVLHHVLTGNLGKRFIPTFDDPV